MTGADEYVHQSLYIPRAGAGCFSWLQLYSVIVDRFPLIWADDYAHQSQTCHKHTTPDIHKHTIPDVHKYHIPDGMYDVTGLNMLVY